MLWRGRVQGDGASTLLGHLSLDLSSSLINP